MLGGMKLLVIGGAAKTVLNNNKAELENITWPQFMLTILAVLAVVILVFLIVNLIYKRSK